MKEIEQDLFPVRYTKILFIFIYYLTSIEGKARSEISSGLKSLLWILTNHSFSVSVSLYTLYDRHYVPHWIHRSRYKGACGPGWCSSVDWVWACKPRVASSILSPGHLPGLQSRSTVGGTWEANTHWYFSPSLSPSLSLYLKNKK